MMKKIFFPILYGLAALFSLTLALGSWELLNLVGVTLFWGTGALVANLIFFITTFTTLFIANIVICSYCDATEYDIQNHFQQSLVFYVMLAYQAMGSFSSFSYLRPLSCDVDCYDFILISLVSLIPLLGIIVNAIYISLQSARIHRKKKGGVTEARF
jgi:hypothetical protein